jgi:hypothetical protein
MKATAAVCACALGTAAAFTGPFVGSAVQQRVVVARGMSMQEAAAPPAPVMSKSVPFVIKPGKVILNLCHNVMLLACFANA